MAGLIGSFGQKLKQKMNTIADDARREKLRAQLRHDIGRKFLDLKWGASSRWSFRPNSEWGV